MIPKQATPDKNTIDYRKIASIPLSSRARLASSGLADVLAMSLTPGQRAALFPRYYSTNTIYTASLGSSQGLITPPASRNGIGIEQAPALPSDRNSAAKAGVPDNLIPAGLIPGPDGQPMRVPDVAYSNGVKAPTSFGSAADKAKKAYDFFKSKGWTDAQAAGLVGNLMHESKLDHTNNTGDGGAAFGIGQWHSSRQKDFERFSGHSIQNSTFDEQLAFVQWELENTEKNAGNLLKSANTPEEAAIIVSDRYERPGSPQLESRIGYAQSIFSGANEGGQTAEALPNVYDLPDGAVPTQNQTASAVPVKTENASFVSPVSGTFAGTENSDYGDARGSYSPGGTSQHGPKTRKHSGSDWQAPTGSDAVFPVNGTVIQAGRHSGYANMVDIKGDDGRIYRLAPHGELAQQFKPGQRVSQGETMGKIAEGHLHMEVIPKQIGGIDNPVYAEFDQALSEGKNRFISTSNQRGTVDPSVELGIDKGQTLVAGTSWKPDVAATATAEPASYTLNKEEAVKLIKNSEQFKANPLAGLATDEQLLNAPEFAAELQKHGVKYDPKTNQVTGIDTASADYKSLIAQYPDLLKPTSDATQTVDMQAQQIVPTPIAPDVTPNPTPPSPAQEKEAETAVTPPQSVVGVPLPTQTSPTMQDKNKPVTPPSKESNGPINLAPTVAGASTSVVSAMERAKGGWTRGFYDI